MPLKIKKPRQVVIKGSQVASLEQFYDVLEAELKLPAHFGRNLDALWDVLTTDVAGPVEIVWENAALSKEKLGDKATAIMELLQDVCEERPDIKVCFK